MKIILIGSGNLATNLGKALRDAGHDIIQVFSRTLENASMLAEVLHAEAVNDYDKIRSDADVYILSVKDSALQNVIDRVVPGRENAIFVHTAGSMPMDMFRCTATHYGVLYPMQTFSKDKAANFSEIPCFIESNDKITDNVVKNLCESISKNIYHLSSEDRKYLHLSAVFACNFANHCYAMAEDLLKKHGVPFDVMLPLIDETARKAHVLSPQKAQTGPAVRYDENVMDRQKELLDGNHLTKQIYELMSESIHKYSQDL